MAKFLWLAAMLAVAAEGCLDTDAGATDATNLGCEDGFDLDPDSCGDYDDNDFSSMHMCCVCGGGLAYSDSSTMLELGFSCSSFGLAEFSDEADCQAWVRDNLNITGTSYGNLDELAMLTGGIFAISGCVYWPSAGSAHFRSPNGLVDPDMMADRRAICIGTTTSTTSTTTVTTITSTSTTTTASATTSTSTSTRSTTTVTTSTSTSTSGSTTTTTSVTTSSLTPTTTTSTVTTSTPTSTTSTTTTTTTTMSSTSTTTTPTLTTSTTTTSTTTSTETATSSSESISHGAPLMTLLPAGRSCASFNLVAVTNEQWCVEYARSVLGVAEIVSRYTLGAKGCWYFVPSSHVVYSSTGNESATFQDYRSICAGTTTTPTSITTTFTILLDDFMIARAGAHCEILDLQAVTSEQQCSKYAELIGDSMLSFSSDVGVYGCMYSVPTEQVVFSLAGEVGSALKDYRSICYGAMTLAQAASTTVPVDPATLQTEPATLKTEPDTAFAIVGWSLFLGLILGWCLCGLCVLAAICCIHRRSQAHGRADSLPDVSDQP